MDRPTIYLDHAATTAVDPRVVDAMLPYFTAYYGNPSSVHHKGRESQKAMEEARRAVAEMLNCDPREIVFTSCGTESDNLAIRGVALAARHRKVVERPHIITSPIEHHAVSHTCEQLAKLFDCEVTVLPVDEYGLVNPTDLEQAIRPNTVLVSIMYANNEVGTIQTIAELAGVARARRIPFHTDAVQAGGSLDLNVYRLGVDLLSLSAHKFYGPKGVGLLYRRQGVPLLPLQTGGSHEGNRRAGTENVPYIVGLTKALELAQTGQAEENVRLVGLRDRLIAGVLERIPHARLTGHPTQRLSNSASFVFEYVEGEGILLLLDHEGICGSSGSACTSAEIEPSHVLTAMGVPVEVAHGSLRLTLGRENTDADVDRVLEVLPPIIQRLRDMSPLYPG
ncbi:MAG: cysteine desulfurase NifS [Chloroflexi bacterium]|nr:cysteine desulfurase NifS [Chloroflexota bacterium]MBU1749438.1 cysteine desulfurase NifS [Chloroflexota bacterium]MBU1878672.1 cysteine desulfurase NifS [Chloroflexota bacterium]